MGQQLKKGKTGHTQKVTKPKGFKEFETYKGDAWLLIPIILLVVVISKLIRRSWRRRGQSPPGPGFVRSIFGRPTNKDGYVLVRSRFGDQLEHRLVAEEILGRRLERGEVVHHINGRRRDNRPMNLCVMDRRDHDAYHEWYIRIHKTYGKYPRRVTQLRKLREEFGGLLLADIMSRNSRAG